MNQSLTLVFLFFTSSLFCQNTYLPLVEEDKHWMYLLYDENDVIPEPVSGYMISMQGDTVIESVIYKKIYQHVLAGSHTCSMPPCFSIDLPYKSLGRQITAFLREDIESRKVYSLQEDGSEKLLYDFSLAVQDSLNQYVLDAIKPEGFELPEASCLVDSIAWRDHYGAMRKAFYAYGIYTYLGLPVISEIPILEGFGFIHQGVFNYVFNRSVLVDFCKGSFAACNILTETEIIDQNSSIQIFPNPVSDYLYIKGKPEIRQVEIYDANGRLVLESQQRRIDLSVLPLGIKIVKLTDEQGNQWIKKIFKN